jgi:polygalacturonase
MAGTNLFQTRKRAHDLRTTNVTTTYTVQTGRSADGHHVDRVVDVTDPAAAFTITIPDGAYEGQCLLINLLSNTSAVNVTVAASTGSAGDSVLDTAGDYMSLEWVNATTGWIVLSELVAS